MTVSTVTLLECDGGASGGTRCLRRLVVRRDFGDWVAPGWTRGGVMNFCPECSCDPDRRQGKRPQYRGPKPSETPQRVDGGSPLRSGDSVPASARGVSFFETRR